MWFIQDLTDLYREDKEMFAKELLGTIMFFISLLVFCLVGIIIF